MDSELQALIVDLGLVPLREACCRWIPQGSNYGVVPGVRSGFCKVWQMQQRFKSRDRSALMVRLYERNRRGSRYAGSESVVDLKLF